MLLILKNVNNGSTFYLTNKSEFIVGRKECDFLIQNDQSISRKHAIVRLKDGKVTVEDCGAKYKTLFKGENLKPNVEVQLKVNDEIQFGVINSKYRLERHNFVTTGTRLSSSQKSKLKDELAVLGGSYIEQWNAECTHLTVEEVTLTVKVLLALLDEKPIVKPTYWTKFAESVQKKMPPPDIDDFNKPPIAEILLNKIELKSNPKRRNLFKGKMFVFPTEKSRSQMEILIRKAGGSSISWEKDPMPYEDIRNSPKEFLIIETPDMPDVPGLTKVITKFSKQNKRSIPVQEIAMAITFCSCEKDCNPSFNRVGHVFPTTGPNEPTQSNPLVPNTESQYFSLRDYETEGHKIIVPDTLEEQIDTSVPVKDLPSTSGIQSTKKIIKEDEKQKCSKDQDVKLTSTSRIHSTDKTIQERERQQFGNKINKPNTVKDINLPSTSTSGIQSTDKIMEVDESNQQVSKRVNNDQLEGNPFKKAKIEQKSIQSEDTEKSTLKLEKKHNFVSKKAVPEKRGVVEGSTKPNPFAFLIKNKRTKPETSSDTNTTNPFKLLRKNNYNVAEMSDTNPFKAIIRKNKRGNDAANESANKRKKEDHIFSSTKLDNLNKSANFSKISKINYSDINSTWISKKTNIELNENIENCMDTELQSFINRFKDTVVVEIMEKIIARPKIYEDEFNKDKSCNGKHNFKKFRKVMPLRPQKIIIGKDSFVPLGPGDTSAIIDSRRKMNFSDDEADDNLRNKKQRPRKFFI